MSEPEEFTLTPAEEAFFRGFFHRLALRYLALGCIVAAALLLGGFFLITALEPSDSEIEEVAPVSPLPAEPEPPLDIRAELERVAAELAAQHARQGNEKAKAALRRAEELARELDAAVQRLMVLEAKIQAAPPPAARPPAAPASQPASAPADLGSFRERLYNMELRQDSIESAQTRDTRSLLDRVDNLERFRLELEQKRDDAQALVLDRLYAIEERLSSLE
jgi:hypothetical protein